MNLKNAKKLALSISHAQRVAKVNVRIFTQRFYDFIFDIINLSGRDTCLGVIISVVNVNEFVNFSTFAVVNY